MCGGQGSPRGGTQPRPHLGSGPLSHSCHRSQNPVSPRNSLERARVEKTEAQKSKGLSTSLQSSSYKGVGAPQRPPQPGEGEEKRGAEEGGGLCNAHGNLQGGREAGEHGVKRLCTRGAASA